MKIYEDIIFLDLEFVVKWLLIGNDVIIIILIRKVVIGFLVKVYLQIIEYDILKKYVIKVLEYVKMLIDDVEVGGVKYNIYLYVLYVDVFKELNNYENKEVFWKY